MPNYHQGVHKRTRDVSRPPNMTIAECIQLRNSIVDQRVSAFRAKIKELSNA